MELPAARNEEAGGPGSRWWLARWWAHLVILGSYPLVLAGLSLFNEKEGAQAMLPDDSASLVRFAGATLLHFAFFLAVAWGCSRASKDAMLLRWREGIAPVWRGFVYSIALRLLVIIVGLLIVVVVVVFQGTDAIRSIRPPAESVIDPEALVADPLYLILNLTFVSFVMAGLREEIWRAGVLAGLWALFPKLKETTSGQVTSVVITAVIFGLGHWSQGWLGVILTTLLGLALGAIMVFHRSIWDAVIAHGFFDGTTFLMLYVIAKLGWDFGGL